MKHQIKNWTVAVAFFGSLLYCCAAHSQGELRPKVHSQLFAAQEALKNNMTEAALKFSADALAVPNLSVMERNAAYRIRAVAASRAQNWDLVFESLEPLVLQKDITAAEKWPMLEALVSASQQKKDYPRLVIWARQYIQDGGPNTSVRTVMIQALALSAQYAEVIKEMQEKMLFNESKGLPHSEEDLRILAMSYRQLNDNPGYLSTLRKLLIAYPSKKYWSETILRIAQTPGLNRRLHLDLYRLLEETGNLEETDEFIGMAQMALLAGLPAEAQRVLTKGYAKGVLGHGALAEAHAKLRSEAQLKAQEDDKLFGQLERAAKDGNSLAGLGDVHASKQNWDEANAAYSQALALGGLRREQELRLHYAISLIRTGQRAEALKQLQSVQGDPLTIEIASLWKLLAR